MTAALGISSASVVLSRVVVWLRALRSGAFAAALRQDFGWIPLLPSDRSARAMLIVFAMAIVVNGLTPYLGTKFRFSFAMFSNLRVDDARWNSLIFPSSLRRGEYDRYLHVERLNSTGGDKIDGLYTSGAIANKLATMRGSKQRFELTVRYRGQQRRFQDAPSNPELFAWLREIPDDYLLHKHLSADGPQRCIH